MTARSTWKACERADAREHGTERIPVNGRTGPDWQNAMFSGQTKLRKTRPKCVDTWLDDINAHARPTGRIGIVVWHKPKEDRSRGVVLLRYADWIALHGS